MLDEQNIFGITKTVLLDTVCCCPCIETDAEPMVNYVTVCRVFVRQMIMLLLANLGGGEGRGGGGAGRVQQHMCSKVMHFHICSFPSMQAQVMITTPPANAAQISAIVGRVTGCSCSTGMLQSWCERRCRLGVRARAATADSKATAHS